MYVNLLYVFIFYFFLGPPPENCWKSATKRTTAIWSRRYYIIYAYIQYTLYTAVMTRGKFIAVGKSVRETGRRPLGSRKSPSPSPKRAVFTSPTPPPVIRTTTPPPYFHVLARVTMRPVSRRMVPLMMRSASPFLNGPAISRKYNELICIVKKKKFH